MGLTQQRALELFEYSPAHRGILWRVTRAKAKAGCLAGCEDKDGYLIVGVDGRRYKVHRVVYLMFNSRLPDSRDRSY